MQDFYNNLDFKTNPLTILNIAHERIVLTPCHIFFFLYGYSILQN